MSDVQHMLYVYLDLHAAMAGVFLLVEPYADNEDAKGTYVSAVKICWIHQLPETLRKIYNLVTQVTGQPQHNLTAVCIPDVQAFTSKLYSIMTDVEYVTLPLRSARVVARAVAMSDFSKMIPADNASLVSILGENYDKAS